LQICPEGHEILYLERDKTGNILRGVDGKKPHIDSKLSLYCKFICKKDEKNEEKYNIISDNFVYCFFNSKSRNNRKQIFSS
jgi:hypothetical protein